MKSRITVLAILTVGLCLMAQAQFNNPNGLAFDSKGNLWLANAGRNQVLELNPANGTVLNTITSGISNPTRLAFDTTGVLWVTNLGSNAVTAYAVKSAGGTLLKTISFDIQRPLGIAVDAYGDVYVANNSANDIVAFNIGGGLIETLTVDKSGLPFDAVGALSIHGRNMYVGVGPGAGSNAVVSYNAGEFLTGDPAEISVYNDNVNTGPTGVAFDSVGNVYISEFYSGTWVKYGPRGGNPLMVISQGVGAPEGIAVDKNGNVYVSNSAVNNITVYSPNGQLTNTLN